MSYYEKRIADLEARVAEMARDQRMKAIRVEAKLVEQIAKLQAENKALRKAAGWQPIETAPRDGGKIYIRSVMFYSKDSLGWAYFQEPATTAEWMHINDDKYADKDGTDSK